MATRNKSHAASTGQVGQPLGDYLVNLRTTRKLSLRDVQEASTVSNAYLSQLENGRIRKPSPWILKKLADLYAVNYETLMEKAGYLPSEESQPQRRARTVVAAGTGSAFGEMTRDEEESLLEYLAFIRSRQGKDK